MDHRPVTALVLMAGLLLVPVSSATTATLATTAASPPTALAAPAAIGATTRVSVASGGAQANGNSTQSGISADGRFVVFPSEAGNLVAGDTNAAEDVFVRDRVSGVTSRVSLTSAGAQANGNSYGKAISANGRYVAFSSEASNLVAGDTNGMVDEFVRDRFSGTTTRVSIASDGAQANNDSELPVISADGSVVGFSSTASNLVAGDTNDKRDLFVHDRVSGATTRASVASDGRQANNYSSEPAISADGRYLAFASFADNLVPGDTNGGTAVEPYDVFVHDRVTGATTRASVASDGTEGNSGSENPSLSADGRYVAFDSAANKLVPGDTNVRQDVFVHDQVTGATTRVSVATGGTQANSYSVNPAISADGRYVAFHSSASNLVPGDTGIWQDVFVRDRVTDETIRVSVAAGGAEANEESWLPVLSADGRFVTFFSWATNLVPGDTNGRADVFVFDRLAPATPFGDFTGEGWSDLIARQTSTGSLYLYPGNGTGLISRVRIGTGWSSMNAITRHGDFNRDGHEDVIARDSATGALWLYRGTGSGLAPGLKIGSGWNGMREITPVGDLNGNGYPDVLAVQTSTGSLYLFPGFGTALGQGSRLGSGWNAMSELAGVGDFNRDGHVDLIARATADGDLWLYPGTGTGLSTRVRIGIGWNGMRDLVGAGDLDRDGFTDLIAVQTATGRLFRYPGRGTTFGSPVQVGSGWTTDVRPVL